MSDVPRWTIAKPYSDAKYADIECDGHHLWAEASDGLPEWLSYEIWDALVRCVRDADTLRQARELASATKGYDIFDIGDGPDPVAALLDLLTEENS